MKLIKKKIGQLIRYINKVYQFFKPFIQKRNYLGYNVYYSKGTSLIERLKEKNSIYEPEACTIIHKHLKNKKNPNFIDVGANIGLISLYVLRNFPSTIQPTDEKTMNRMIEYIQNAEFNEEDL
jgi:hypothetical protein